MGGEGVGVGGGRLCYIIHFIAHGAHNDTILVDAHHSCCYQGCVELCYNTLFTPGSLMPLEMLRRSSPITVTLASCAGTPMVSTATGW